VANALIWHYEEMGCGLFFYGMIGETSTVFLDLRWACIATGATKSHPRFFSFVNNAFALTFFITRNVLLGYGVFYMVIELLYPSFADGFHWYQLSCMCLVMGYCLNLFWLSKIIGSVIGGKSPETPHDKSARSSLKKKSSTKSSGQATPRRSARRKAD
jgi:hypothetical protein